MKKHANNNFYDVTKHLEEKFGPVGSESWRKEEDRAWEEYNAEILRDARKEVGMSQSELAERIGADKAYISKVENGHTIPTVASFYRIVSAMGMHVELKRSEYED
ncbi:MAG: helix-turn-helix transcriptional regulator [Bacteroidales bacterium]|nr:helix-turn-helix transcriptional regulator [Bacteroidales bacterium]